MTPITLELTGIAHGGEAFGRHDGKIIFTPYSIPGETVEVELVEEKARWARARLLNVISPSPDRVEPPCPYFGAGQCGGCQWQHIAYERQLALKKEIVADQLRRLGRIEEPPVEDPIALANDDGLLAYGYRNNAQLRAADDRRFGFIRDAQGLAERSEEVVVGPRSGGRGRREEDVIPVDECLLLHPLLDEMVGALVAGAPEETPVAEGGDAGEEEAAQPPVKIYRVELRAGANTGQRLLTFTTRKDRAPNFRVEDLPVRCVIRRRDGVIEPLIGDPWIEEIVADQTFRVSAGSFFQVNTVGAEALVQLAGEMLAPTGHETLLDGYCGVGLFALSLARQVGQVIGVEESEAACDDFAWNGRDFDNVALFEGAVHEVLESLYEPGDLIPNQRIDMALIDPPRSGVGPEVIKHLRALRVRRLLYISCDPATLARDARLLTGAGYTLRQVQPVDMFPQTFQIESLALFTL